MLKFKIWTLHFGCCVGCLLHCTTTSGLLTECGAYPMYSVCSARNPLRGIHCCFLLCSLHSFRQACYCKHRACWQLTVQTSMSCLQAINCIRGVLTETEPTNSPNVDTGTTIVSTLRNRTAKEWLEFAFQLPPPVLSAYLAFPLLFWAADVSV